MLNDLTLDMWVPSLRWMVAHRMHRKMPNCNTSSLALAREYLDSRMPQRGGMDGLGRVEIADNVHSMTPKL
jgi:hypothetical protein